MGGRGICESESVCHLHVPELLGAVQDVLHLGIELHVVIRLDVEHKVLIGHSQVACKGQVICPAPARYMSGDWQSTGLAQIGRRLPFTFTGHFQLPCKGVAINSNA